MVERCRAACEWSWNKEFLWASIFCAACCRLIPVVLGTTLLVYALVFALPGDPVKAMFGDKPVNPAVAAQIRAEYNLDKPFIVQYFIFLKNALTLDFGKTFSGQLVIDEIGRAFPVTIKLAIMAFVFEAIFGVVFGVISGLKKGKWYDTVILIVSLLLISVPTFVTGFLGQYFLGVKWSILPVTAGNDPTFIDLLMPAMVLGSVSMAYIIRLTRSEISSNIAEDYVRTARAKGMSNRQVMLRHVLRNSLIPVVTYLGQDIAALMGGAIDLRDHLQHPRHRLADLPEHPQGRRQPRGVHRDAAHADLRGLQSYRRSAVRGTRSAYPLRLIRKGDPRKYD